MCTKISFILSNKSKPYTVGARSWVPNEIIVYIDPNFSFIF